MTGEPETKLAAARERVELSRRVRKLLDAAQLQRERARARLAAF